VRVWIVGASGELGKYMVAHSLDRGHQAHGYTNEFATIKRDLVLAVTRRCADGSKARLTPRCCSTSP
jgi:putative NADH-flavin reductase